jgi:hypothetical protein
VKSRARVPVSCPPGFVGSYIVTAGDTMFNIAQFLRIPLTSLIAANPHITNPANIVPGDVLCSPGLVPYPCCLVLSREMDVPTGTGASAFVYLSALGTISISLVAALPRASAFGDFDIFLMEVIIPQINGFGNELFETLEDPPTFSTTVSLPTAAQLTPESRVVVRPANSDIGVSGPVILGASLADCCRLPMSIPDESRMRGRSKGKRRVPTCC